MKKDIYCITNLINGKIYIGQSIDIKRRFLEHLTSDSIIGKALRKYGKNNFEVKILEKGIENYNERECHWITFFNSNNRDFGYNRTDGGEAPPIFKGDSSKWTFYSDNIMLQIQKDLIGNTKSFSKISEEYNISTEYLTIINRGLARKNLNFIYPLRKNGNEILEKEIVLAIEKTLMYTSLSIESIARKFSIGSNVIYDINQGKHRHSSLSCFPIREKYCRYSTFFLITIIKELKKNEYTFSQIEKMYNLSKSTLSKINQGKIYYQKNVHYPFRSSSQRVYNPVETIPS